MEENPLISGEETMEVAISQQLVDKKEHIEALTQLLEELKIGSGKKNTGTRLMLLGSENDDILNPASSLVVHGLVPSCNPAA